MAQDNRDSSGASSSTSGLCTSECSTPFKFNVHAPEFVPMSSPLTAAGYFSPFVQLSGAGGGIALAADWSFFGEPEPTSFFMAPGLAHVDIGCSVQSKGASPADIANKIVKQVCSKIYQWHINIRFLCPGPWAPDLKCR
jgi:La-related protein 7